MSARGECVIHVDGKEIPLLFTNRALLSAEKQLGKGILGILEGFVNGTGGFTELVGLMRAGMEAARIDARTHGPIVSNNDAIDIIDKIGFTAAIEPVMEAVAAVISYTSEEEGAATEGEPDPN